jgi:hypothetical protein
MLYSLLVLVLVVVVICCFKTPLRDRETGAA